MTDERCPRCGGPLYPPDAVSDAVWLEIPAGARSADDIVQVCEACAAPDAPPPPAGEST
jgi:hypothetical protein